MAIIGSRIGPGVPLSLREDEKNSLAGIAAGAMTKAGKTFSPGIELPQAQSGASQPDPGMVQNFNQQRATEEDIQRIFKPRGEIPSGPGVDMSLLNKALAAQYGVKSAFEKREAEAVQNRQAIGEETAVLAEQFNQEVRRTIDKASYKIQKADADRVAVLGQSDKAVQKARDEVSRVSRYLDSGISPDDYDRLEAQSKSDDPDKAAAAHEKLRAAKQSSPPGQTFLTILAAILAMSKKPAGGQVAGVIQGFLNNKIREREGWMDRNEARYKNAFNELRYFRDTFEDMQTAKLAYRSSLLDDMNLQVQKLQTEYKSPEQQVALAQTQQTAMELANKTRLELDQRIASAVGDTALTKFRLQADLASKWESPLDREQAQARIENEGWAPIRIQSEKEANISAEISGKANSLLGQMDRLNTMMGRYQQKGFGNLDQAEISALQSTAGLIGLGVARTTGSGAFDEGLRSQLELILPNFDWKTRTFGTEGFRKFLTSFDLAKLQQAQRSIRTLASGEVSAAGGYYAPEFWVKNYNRRYTQ